jgi:CRP-like cAMP-binding protein
MKKRVESSQTLLPFLKRVPLFAGLSDADLLGLACVCRLQKIPKGQILFQRGDAGSAAYLIRSGAIAMLVSTPDGRELVVNELHAGICFGELALLTGKPRSATAMATAPCEFLQLSRAELMEKLEQQPRVMWHLVESLAQRLAAATERESELAFLDAPARLARTLLQLERAQTVPGEIRISHEELARRIGVTRQTVTKVMGRWRRAGWIASRRHRIVLRDRRVLQERASQEIS